MAEDGRIYIFYPECETVDIGAQCRKAYAGPLTIAEDLMTMTVG